VSNELLKGFCTKCDAPVYSRQVMQLVQPSEALQAAVDAAGEPPMPPVWQEVYEYSLKPTGRPIKFCPYCGTMY
jgi:hypothetical protein